MQKKSSGELEKGFPTRHAGPEIRERIVYRL